MENTKTNTLIGGEFLVKEIDHNAIFTPEDFNEEQKMMKDMCDDFIKAEITPILPNLDKQEDGLMRTKINKAGEYGLLGAGIPEQYGGMGVDFISTMLLADSLGSGHSFAVAYSAHTGIGSLPLLYYGNEEQKQRYLPKLATGEFAAAYCLTEPDAGSDANAGRTKAVLSEDGKHYILNGQKMWITNGGFADLLTVFAKIDNDRILSAFLIESSWEGISFNPEENKMGIKGSSTRQIFFNDVKVPVENLLGRRGEGFRIALNILHVGRVKLGASVLGAGRAAIGYAVNYANERKQFGRYISSFGAIKEKLAEQAIKEFVTQSAVYRASGDINLVAEENMSNGMEKGPAEIDAISKYAIEAAILKVFGSEALDYIVDEAVQIYGGMGFSAEAPVDRSYRDSRINRIFEGTNEINRMVIIDTLLKFIKRGDYDLFGIGNELYDTIDNLPIASGEGYYNHYSAHIKNLKNLAILILTAAQNKLKKQLGTEQEIMMSLSDMIQNVYMAESTLLRVQKIEEHKQTEMLPYYKDILDVFIYEATKTIVNRAIDSISSFADDDYDKLISATWKLGHLQRVNIKDARRRIADKLINENKYCF
jgi:alkylation response protein AidB-like acyl-CoA dehydrogenase